MKHVPRFGGVLATHLSIALGVLVVPAWSGAAQPNPTPTERYSWQGTATLEVAAHAFEDGFNDGQPEFISRYMPLRSPNGDDYPGYYADLSLLKLALVDNQTQRRIVGLNRQAFGYFNQRNVLYFDPEPLRLEISYSLYRSQQLKPLNIPDPATTTPGVVANNIFAVFNDDSFGRTDYYSERSDFGFKLRLRPSAFGHDGSVIGDVKIGYAGSQRDSVRYFDYVLTRRLAGGANWEQVRWRGINQKIDEDVNRVTLSLSASPWQWINVSYDMSVEKYERDFRPQTLADVAQIANVPSTPFSSAATNSGPLTFIDKHNTEFWPLEQVSLGWVPSTIKFINKIKFDKRIGRGALNFGYANVLLKQENFSAFAVDRGYDHSRITTHSAFANWTMPLTKAITWNAHANYRLRDNGSEFPVLDPQRRLVNPTTNASVFDYMNPLLDGGKHASVFGPWIKGIDTRKFGTDFTILHPLASSRVVAGWVHEDTTRDLIFGNPPPGQVRTIDPNEAYVRPDSLNDTFFVKYSAQPKKKLRLRWNNSFTLGDETALITEADTGYKTRFNASYFWAKFLQGATLDGFYQARYAQNDSFRQTSLSNDFTTLLSSARQDREQWLQSGGLTFTVVASEKTTGYAGYIWNRDQLEANLLLTSARRYENNWTFVSANRERYMSDAHTVFLGTSHEFNDRWFGSLDYSISRIEGEVGSGEVRTVRGNENEIDNLTQHITASLTFQMRQNLSIAGKYAYARYDDEVYSSFSSGYHTFAILASTKF